MAAAAGLGGGGLAAAAGLGGGGLAAESAGAPPDGCSPGFTADSPSEAPEAATEQGGSAGAGAAGPPACTIRGLPRRGLPGRGGSGIAEAREDARAVVGGRGPPRRNGSGAAAGERYDLDMTGRAAPVSSPSAAAAPPSGLIAVFLAAAIWAYFKCLSATGAWQGRMGVAGAVGTGRRISHSRTGQRTGGGGGGRICRYEKNGTDVAYRLLCTGQPRPPSPPPSPPVSCRACRSRCSSPLLSPPPPATTSRTPDVPAECGAPEIRRGRKKCKVCRRRAQDAAMPLLCPVDRASCRCVYRYRSRAAVRTPRSAPRSVHGRQFAARCAGGPPPPESAHLAAALGSAPRLPSGRERLLPPPRTRYHLPKTATHAPNQSTISIYSPSKHYRASRCRRNELRRRLRLQSIVFCTCPPVLDTGGY